MILYPGAVAVSARRFDVWPNDDKNSDEFEVSQGKKGDVFVIISETNDHWYAVGCSWIGYVHVKVVD